jgi:AcrR family transcriptional regulator
MGSPGSGGRSGRHGNRRDELVEAAAAVFARNGVAATTVDDVVREAGVAKGTFYLYFTTKDEVVTAVAERLVEVVGAVMERSLAAVGRSAADRLQGVALAMTTVGERPYERELIEMIHRPENQAIHDRLGGRIVAALRPAVAAVIADGIRDGEFAPQDPGQAAAFVLATMVAVEELADAPDDLPAVVDAVNAFVLRGLGHRAGGRR